MRRSIWKAGFALACLAPAVAGAAIVINYPSFANCAGLQLNANAACTQSVLRVTPATFSQAGSAFSQSIIPLGPGNSFSTYFTFRIDSNGGSGDGDGLGADGIVFALQPNANTAGGGGGGIGFQGIANSVGVEFDTWNNGLPGDPDGNHVGIDVNGSVTSVVAVPVSPRLNDGNVWHAWVDYNGTAIEVRVAQTATRPATPIISHTVNLAGVIGGSQAFAGFTSGTGAAFANHDILSWVFDNTYSPIGGTPVSTAAVPTLSHAALAIMGLIVAAVAGLRLGRR